MRNRGSENRNSLNMGKAPDDAIIAPIKGCMQTLLAALLDGSDLPLKKVALLEFIKVFNFLSNNANLDGKDVGLPILSHLLPDDLQQLKKVLPILEQMFDDTNPNIAATSSDIHGLATLKIDTLEGKPLELPLTAKEIKAVNAFMKFHNDPNSYAKYQQFKKIIEQIDGTINALDAYYKSMQSSVLSLDFKNQQALQNQIKQLEQTKDKKTLSELKDRLTAIEGFRKEYLLKAEPLAKIKNALQLNFNHTNIGGLLKEAKERNADNPAVLHAIGMIAKLIINKEICAMLDNTMADLRVRFVKIRDNQLPQGFKTVNQLKSYIAKHKNHPAEWKDILDNLEKHRGILDDKVKLLTTVKEMAANDQLDHREAKVFLRDAKTAHSDDITLVNAIEHVSSLTTKSTWKTPGISLYQAVKETPEANAKPSIIMGKKK